MATTAELINDITARLSSASGRGWSREEIIEGLNQALIEVGNCLQINSTLTGVPDQLSYTLPAGVQGVRRVQVGEARDNNYYWDEVAGQLIFKSGQEPGSGEAIYIFYTGSHAAVQADADVVSPYIDRARVAWLAAMYTANNRIQRMSGAGSSGQLEKFVNMAQQKASEAGAARPNQRMAKDPTHGGT
jgi:hypothetical protein